MNNVSIVLSLAELGAIREALHTIQIRGIDAPLVAHILNKVYKGIDDLNSLSTKNDGESESNSAIIAAKIDKTKK